MHPFVTESVCQRGQDRGTGIVAADGSGHVTTLGEGVARAADGDTIAVRPGTYDVALEIKDADLEIEEDEVIGNLMSNVSVLLVMMIATLVLSFGSFRAAAIISAVAVAPSIHCDFIVVLG